MIDNEKNENGGFTMHRVTSYQELCDAIKNRNGVFPGMFDRFPESGTIGIVFCNPNNPGEASSIIKNMDYFNERSSYWISFYFPGFCDWMNSRDPNVYKFKVGEAPWEFSSKQYVEFIEEFESHTNWEYSGNTELLLIGYENGQLLYDNVVSIRIDEEVDKGHILNANELFEVIFRIAKETSEIEEFKTKLQISYARNHFFDRVIQYISSRTGFKFGGGITYRSINISPNRWG